MMHIFVILIFLSPFSIMANQEDCPIEILSKQVISLGNDVSLPNCRTNDNLSLAVKGKLVLCKKCVSDFKTKIQGDQKNKIDVTKEKQKQYLKLAVEEFKKVLANNLIEVAKLRSLPSTKSDFRRSISACSIDNLDLNGCGNLAKSSILNEISNMKSSLANELAHIISDSPLSDLKSGLLERTTKKNLCPISEKKILYASNKAIEDYLSPEILNAISKINDNEIKSLGDLIDSLKNSGFSNLDQIRSQLISHPLLGIHQKNPQTFLQLVRNLNPRNSFELKKMIYSKHYGDSFDQSLSDSCNNSFSKFKQAVCSKDFESGNFSFNPFKEIDKIENAPIIDESELAHNESLIKANLQALQYCEIAQSPGNSNGNDQLNEISKNLGTELAKKPIKTYAADKYNNDISRTHQRLCESLLN